MTDTTTENLTNETFNFLTDVPNFAIDASTSEELCFVENLMICAKNEFSSDTNPIGGYCINVERMGPKSREFLVNVAASMNVEGCFAGGSKLVGSVTENFRCLEEKRNEFLHRPDGTYEKSLYIGNEDNSYYIRYENSCPCDSSSSSYDVPLETSSKLFSEAANIVLMRYLSLKNFHGSFSLESVTIDGKIEACDYRCNSAEWKRLDGRSLEIYTVERRNLNATNPNANRESKTLLTKRGRIVRHDWLKIPFLLRINPLVDPRTIENCEIGVYRPLRDNWTEDFELLAQYLDRKTCTIAQKTDYFESHPEIKKLMADYTQTLLIVKPTDVIGFTIQYFKSFAPNPETVEENSISSDE